MHRLQEKKYLDVHMLLSPSINELCWAVVKTALVKSRGLAYRSVSRASSKCIHRNCPYEQGKLVFIKHAYSHLYVMSNDKSHLFYMSYCECMYRLIYIQKHPHNALYGQHTPLKVVLAFMYFLLLWTNMASKKDKDEIHDRQCRLRYCSILGVGELEKFLSMHRCSRR